MTASEAIKILKKDSCYECAQGTDSPFNCEYGGCRVAKATRVAIQALEEVQQYRAIGTPEEYLAAVEKQEAKKPKEYEDKFYGCPACGNVLLHKWEKYPTKLMNKKNGLPYCLGCGQKLDWSDEE